MRKKLETIKIEIKQPKQTYRIYHEGIKYETEAESLEEAKKNFKLLIKSNE